MTPNAKREPLKPCAHCGGEASVQPVPFDAKNFHVRCHGGPRPGSDCDVRTAPHYLESVVIEQWNRRAVDVEAVRKVAEEMGMWDAAPTLLSIPKWKAALLRAIGEGE